MKISIYAKNIQLTEALKEAAIKKIRRLAKFFQQDIEAKVVLRRIIQRHV